MTQTLALPSDVLIPTPKIATVRQEKQAPPFSCCDLLQLALHGTFPSGDPLEHLLDRIEARP